MSESDGATGQITYAIIPFVLNPSVLGDAAVGDDYGTDIRAVGATAPVQFVVSNGALPPGLTGAVAAGVVWRITGRLTTAGSYSFRLTATDATGHSASADYTVNVARPPLLLGPDWLPQGVVGMAYSADFTATGGAPPYSFSKSASCPSELTLSASGAMRGTPVAVRTVTCTISVNDSQGARASRDYQMVIVPATLTLPLPDLPPGALRTAYSAPLFVSGGVGPYVFALTYGALPSGLTLSAEGPISGTPQRAGGFSFTVGVQDSQGGTGSRNYSIQIAGDTITLGPASLPDITLGQPYSAQLTASGGTPPYTFTLVSGVWCADLHMNSNGSITGTPTGGVGGPLWFIAAAVDANGSTGSANFQIRVPTETITIGPAALPSASLNQPYSAQMTATGGTGPYTFAITLGSLPPGLTLNGSTGLISGTTPTGGPYTFRITATDSRGLAGSAVYTLALPLPTFTVSPTTYPPANSGTPYSLTFEVTGGASPYTWTLEPGERTPPGLTLSSQGVLAGTPTLGGNYSLHARITDAVDNFNILTVALDVYDILPQTLPDAVLNTAYAQDLSTAGFIDASMSLASGALPPGLNFVSTPRSGSAPLNTIQGTPTQAGSFTFTMAAAGSAGQRATRTYTIAAAPPAAGPLTLDVTMPVTGWIGELYSGSLTPSPASYGPFTFSVSDGALPPGLTLNAGAPASITGRPTAAGEFRFTVTVQAGSRSANRSCTIRVLATHLALAPATIPAGRVNQAYSATFAPSSGTPPYYVSIDQAPPGLVWSLDSPVSPTTGTLSGQPAAAGTYSFRVTVHDSGTDTVYRDYSLAVTGSALAIQPATLPVFRWGVPYSVQLTASGGTPPYAFNATCCWPFGVALSSSGLLSGTPSLLSSASVAVTARDSGDGAAQITYAIAYTPPAFTLDPMTLQDGNIGVPYFNSIAPSGATAPVQYAVSNGTLPPGLTASVNLGQFWQIGGTPTTVGSYPFRLTATDVAGRSVGLDYVIHIASPPIQISPDSLPRPTVGLAYAVDFTAAGGAPPYAFTASSSCPIELALSASGAWRGTPVAARSFTCRISVTDSRSVTVSRDYQFSIAPAVLTVTPASLPPGAIRTAYSTTLQASGGAAPYSFAIGSGALPSGLALSAAGLLGGTPQQSGNFSVRITAQDAQGAAGFRDCQLQISGDTITLGPASLPDATLNQPYSAQLTASGGTAPYSFSLSGGTWYAGLRLNPGGSITGTPAGGNGGTNRFTVIATDASGSAGSASFQLRVAAPGGASPITLGPSSLPVATLGQAYSAQLTASGGSPPFRFSLVSGALYQGLQLGENGAVTGTPAGGSGGVSEFMVTATDSGGAGGSASFQMRVLAPAPASLSAQTASLAAAGGDGSVELVTDLGASWTAASDAAWAAVTDGASGSGSRTVGFSVLPNTGAARAGTIRIADQTLAIQQEGATSAGLSLAGSIAQIASAGGWETSLTLVNLGGAPADARLNFSGNDGSAPWLPFTYPQQAASGTAVGTTFTQTLAGGASLVLDTTGPESQALEGFGELRAGGDVGAFAVFTYTPTGQAAVSPLETRDARSYLLAFDNTGSVSTGLAVANLAAAPADVNVVIRDDGGAQIGSGIIRLPAMGHTSFMLPDSKVGFPSTEKVRGVVELDAGAGRISVLGLRANAITSNSDFALTSLPVLADVGSGGGVLPHFASGAGWQTTVTLVNTGDAAAAANLDFFDDRGNALPLPLSFPQTGEREMSGSVRKTIPAHGSLVIAVENSGDANSQGSAVLGTTGRVGGFAVFRYDPTGQEAVSPLQAVNTPAYVLAFDNTTSLSTGFAIANAASQTAAVNAIFRNDAGAWIGSGVINLPAHGHTSFMLADTSSGGWAITAGIRGTIELDTPTGGRIAPLGLRAASLPGRFTVTSIPLMSPR